MVFQKFQGSQSYYSLFSVKRSAFPAFFGMFKRGKVVDTFEKKLEEYFQVKKAYALSSARLSLYYILRVLNLPTDSEVLMTPITIADMVNMIKCNKLRPKFVEMDKETINISLDDLKSKITPKSKVLFLTYLYGTVPYNIEEIIQFAREKGLIIIEDVSQSIGVTYNGKVLGNLGDYTICSFSSFKTISTLYGGAILTNKPELVDKVRALCEKELHKPTRKIFFVMIFKIFIHKFFMSDLVFSLFTFPFLKLVNKINPTLHYKVQTGNIGVILGLGKTSGFSEMQKALMFHYTDFQAKLGLKSLAMIKKINSNLTDFAGLLLESDSIKQYFPRVHSSANRVYWRFPLYIGDKPGIKEQLFKKGIETSLNSLPVCSEEECFKDVSDGSLPGAVDIHHNYLLIPFHGWFNKHKILKIKKRLMEILN